MTAFKDASLDDRASAIEYAKNWSGEVMDVRPNDDLIEHLEGDDCVCGPDMLVEGDAIIWVHHSLDGREQDEVT